MHGLKLNAEIDFLDIITLVSFLIQVESLEKDSVIIKEIKELSEKADKIYLRQEEIFNDLGRKTTLKRV